MIDLQDIVITASIFLASNIATAIISSKVALILSERREKRAAHARLMNRLTSLAHELKANFHYLESAQNPFITKALENLIYEEPLIHHDEHKELFDKCQKCLGTVLILSVAQRSKKDPSTGQQLIKELSEFLSDRYKIKVHDFE